jgi:hypothetical protein
VSTGAIVSEVSSPITCIGFLQHGQFEEKTQAADVPLRKRRINRGALPAVCRAFTRNVAEAISRRMVAEYFRWIPCLARSTSP